MGRSRRTSPPPPPPTPPPPPPLLLLLLLGLSCLVHCVHGDSTLAPTVTTAPPPAGGPATIKPSTVAPTTKSPISTTGPPAGPPTGPPTDKPTGTEKPTTAGAPPKGTAPPTKSTAIVTTKAPAEKGSSPSAGGGTARSVIITTVSKVESGPTAGPKSSGGPPVAGGPTVAAGPTVAGATSPQTPGTTRHAALTTPPGTTPSGTTPPGSVPLVPRDTGPTGAAATAAATTTKGAAPTDATTKRDATKAAGATAAVTSSSGISPDAKLRPGGSTAPPAVPHTTKGSPPLPPKAATTESRVRTAESPTPATPAAVTPAAATPPEATPPEATPPEATPHDATTAAARVFSYCLNKGHQSEEEKELVSLCQRLMGNLEDGNCTVSFRHHHDRVLFESVEISGKVKMTIVTQHFEDITKKPTDNRTLITILASCGALLIMIIILAVCASQHRKPYSGNQLHLTEELQTVEDGYHDNPTLEVMEVGVDMQEKKPPPPSLRNGGGDFNDSWIVPLDNLLKEDGPDEEDTHL